MSPESAVYWYWVPTLDTVDDPSQIYLTGILPAYEAAKAEPKRQATLPLIVDSNAYDFLVATPEVQRAAVSAHESGRVTLLMTHIQYDEILAIPTDDPTKAAKRSAIVGLPCVFAPTYGLVVGTSRIGWARVVGQSDDVDRFRSPDRNHTNDALLAATAEYEQAVLVTNDDRLANFAARHAVEVWDPRRLVAFLTT